MHGKYCRTHPTYYYKRKIFYFQPENRRILHNFYEESAKISCLSRGRGDLHNMAGEGWDESDGIEEQGRSECGHGQEAGKGDGY